MEGSAHLFSLKFYLMRCFFIFDLESVFIFSWAIAVESLAARVLEASSSSPLL